MGLFEMDTTEYQISDGVARRGDTVWWHSRLGVVEVNEKNWSEHTHNMQNHPMLYSLQNPTPNPTQLITWHLICVDGLPHYEVQPTKNSKVYSVLLCGNGMVSKVERARLRFIGGDVSRPFWISQKTHDPIENHLFYVKAWADPIEAPNFDLFEKLQKNNKV